MNLAKDIYLLTASFPEHQHYVLVKQMQRSAISIASNIAEGSGRGTNKDFVRFLHIANGSACELETQLLLAKELNLVADGLSLKLLNKLTEIQKMNFTFRQRLIST